MIWSNCYYSAVTCAEKYVIKPLVLPSTQQNVQGINRINMWREWPQINFMCLCRLRIEWLCGMNVSGTPLPIIRISTSRQGFWSVLFVRHCRSVFVWLLLCVHRCDWRFLFWLPCKESPYLDLSFLADMQQTIFLRSHDWNDWCGIRCGVFCD